MHILVLYAQKYTCAHIHINMHRNTSICDDRYIHRQTDSDLKGLDYNSELSIKV